MSMNLICVIDEQEVVLEYFIVRISDDIEELRQVEEHARVCHNLLGVKEMQEVQEVHEVHEVQEVQNVQKVQ